MFHLGLGLADGGGLCLEHIQSRHSASTSSEWFGLDGEAVRSLLDKDQEQPLARNAVLHTVDGVNDWECT